MFAPHAPYRDFIIEDLAIEESWFQPGWVKDWVILDMQCFGGDLDGPFAFSRYLYSGGNDPSLIETKSEL